MADERVQEGQQGEWELVKDPTGYEFFMGFFLYFFLMSGCGGDWTGIGNVITLFYSYFNY